MSQPGKGGLFGRGANSSQVEVFTGIQVSTSMYGQVIPYLAGRQRASYNLLWYGDFSAVQGSSPGKGGGRGNGSYIYSAAFLAGICLGPIVGVNRVWHDKAIVDLEFENLELSLGGAAPPIWPFLTANFPADAIPYDHIAYVATPGYNFGSSPSMPNLNFEVDGNPGPINASANMLDADPSAFLPTYLTDPVIGSGFPGTLAPMQGLTNTWQAYIMSLGLTTSPYENTQRAATDFTSEVMQCTNSDILLSVGTLKAIPYADQPVSGTTPDGRNWSYTPNLTPVFSFNDGDYCPAKDQPPVKMTRKALADTHNIVNIEYLDRSNYYNAATVPSSDLNDIALHGPRVMDTISLHQITNAQTARMVGQLILQADLYERNTLEWQTRADYLLLEPMDYVAVTDSNLGLVDQVVRLTEVTLTSDYVVKFKGIEVPGVVRSTPQYNWDSAQGYFQNYAVDPGSVLAPDIFQMPAVPAAESAGVAIGIAVAGSPSNAVWGGCSVYASVVGGSTYFFVGTVGSQGPARYGTTSSNISAVPDPDTTSTLGIALANTNLQLQPVTDADADENQTLLLLDSGTSAEVVSYGSATLTGPGTYNLSYLRRGLYGSSSQAHASGVSAVRLDGSIFQIGFDPGMAGQQVYFKFPSFNIFGWSDEDISTVATYSYTIPAGAVAGEAHLEPRGSCSLTGTTIYKSTKGAAAWDSDCVSSDAIAGGVQVFAKYGTGKNLAVGLVTSVATVLNPTSNMDFCWYVNNGVWTIAENGVQQGNFGAAQPGDVVQVVYDNYRVSYMINGTQKRAVVSPGTPFFIGVAMFDPGDVLGPVTYTTLAGTLPIGNFLSMSSWRVGQFGSQGNFLADLTNTGGSNAIVLGDGSGALDPLAPAGNTQPVWRAIGGTLGAGIVGWHNTQDLLGLDPTKSYRVSLWMRFTGPSSAGDMRLGADDTGGSITNLAGAVDTNPQFCFGLLSAFTADKWYLAVGVIHASSYTGGQTGISGFYDPATGDRVPNTQGVSGGSFVTLGSDFKFTPNVRSTKLRAFLFATTSSSTALLMTQPRFEEMGGREPAIRDLLIPGIVDPTVTPSQLPVHAARHGVLPRGNMMPMVQDAQMSYTSTPTTLTFSWTAFNVYRPDGSVFAMTAGSLAISSLTASTTYQAYAYSLESAPSTMNFATGLPGSTGSPSVLYPSATATLAQLAQAFALASALNCIYQGKASGSTPASGSGGGGGGGGGFGCPHQDQNVLTPNGLVRASHLKVGDELLTPAGWSRIVHLEHVERDEFYTVEFNNGERQTVTGDHRFVAPDDEQVHTHELRIGQILKTEGPQHLRVVAIRLRERKAVAVCLELADPHVYYLTRLGPLSHNLKP